MVYPQACKFLKLKTIYYSFAKRENVIEGTIQYIKDRTESFDDYFHIERKELQTKIYSQLV
jgi:hypothetical protein